MNDRVLKAIEVGSVFKIPEDFTQKEESYAKACIFFNRGKYEECLLEIIFLDGCGLIDMPLVISAFCLYLQTKVHYSVLYIVSIIIRQHADKIDSHFSTCLKDAIYGYGLKHDEYPKCIEDNLQSFIYKKIDLDIDYDKLKNSTVVNCYYNESSCGIGDYLRGCCSMFELLNTNGVNFEMSFANSDMSQYITTNCDKNFSVEDIFDTEKHDKENCCAHEYFNNMVKNINTTFKNPKKVHYIFSNYIDENNAFDPEDLSSKCKEFMQSNLNFCSDLETIAGDYEVAHFRLGDKHCLSDFETTQENINTDDFDIDYEKLLENIVKLHNDSGSTIVVLSDSNKFKDYVDKSKNDGILVMHTNSQHSSNNPGFIKSMSIDKQAKSDNMMYCALDMKIISKAKKLHSYSVYPWGSGFSLWIARIFDVPTISNSV